jgi:phosphoribosylformylglycinamidine synthase
LIYLAGETGCHLGGSLLAEHYQLAAGSVPTLPPNALQTARALHRAICQGLVRACHDLSEGGLAVAAAEMALAGGWGLNLDLASLPITSEVDHPLVTLFSESNGRWLVEVAPEKREAFEDLMQGCRLARCGEVTARPWLKIGPIEIEVSRLNAAWRGQAL